MDITLLHTKEKSLNIREEDFYQEIIQKIEENKQSIYDLNVLYDYFYLVPDMLRDEVSKKIKLYPGYETGIISIKDKDSTISDIQVKLLLIHKEEIEEHNEQMRKREETNKAHQHYNDLLKKLPKSQQTAFGPLFIESVDERGLNMRHENGELYGIKEDKEDGYFDFSSIKEDLPFLKDLRFYINLKNIEDSIVKSNYSGVKITPDNGPSIFIPFNSDYDRDNHYATIGLTYNGVMVTSITI